MQRRDYYIEFHEELDRALQAFVRERLEKDPFAFHVAGHSVAIPLVTSLFYQLMGEREAYNAARLKGKSISSSLAPAVSYLACFSCDAPTGETGETGETDEDTPTGETGKTGETDEDAPDGETEEKNDPQAHEWQEALKPFRGQLVFYLYNYRQLNYLAPLLRHLDTPAVLLSSFDLPDEAEELHLPACVTSVPFPLDCPDHPREAAFSSNFPFLYAEVYTFDLLVRMLAPRCVICLEGCHAEEQAWAVIARDYGIPAVGIQQGWPSMIRTGFRQLPFADYFTWGDRFNACWQRYNPRPRFASLGYMYEVEDAVSTAGREAVSFFLQGPLFLSDGNYLQELIGLLEEAAAACPEQLFWVREHPEFPLPETERSRIKALSNIAFVSDLPLKQVMRRSRIVVSHFSSSLMECLVHGALPLAYDPTSGSRYYPDLEAEKLGKIAKNPEEFRACLSFMQDHYEQIREQVRRRIPAWFARTGRDTLEAMKKRLLSFPVRGDG